jgi:hypothetical protein
MNKIVPAENIIEIPIERQTIVPIRQQIIKQSPVEIPIKKCDCHENEEDLSKIILLITSGVLIIFLVVFFSVRYT